MREMDQVYTTSAFLDYVESVGDNNPEKVMRLVEVFSNAYNRWMDYIESSPGSKAVADMFDRKLSQALYKRRQNGQPGPTCKAKCSTCCTILVTLTNSEADYLAAYIREKGIVLDIEKLQRQALAKTDNDFIGLKYEDRSCVLLDGEGNCSVYSARPILCRKYMVASPAWMCDTRKSKHAAVIIDIELEAFASAIMMHEKPAEQSDDNLSVQLLKRFQ